MKTTYGDLREGGQYEIVVQVRDCSRAQVENRAFELTVEDINGTRFPFIVWEASEEGADYDWQEGHWYRLRGVTINEWPSGKVLHGTSALEVVDLGTRRGGEEPSILYLTDSHLGKTIHEYKGKSWSVSPEGGFRSAIEYAITEDVDAVVHGGDLFHNPGSGISDQSVAICREGLVELAEHGTPFYFIHGNHERQAGRRVMERFADDGLAVHLGPRYETIENELAIYGVDYSSKWSEVVLDLEEPPSGMTTILCVHQAIEPFSKSNNPDDSPTGLQQTVTFPLDLIVTGHTHTRSKYELGGSKALSGGATTRVGEDRDDLLPSSELISVDKGEISVHQQYL